MINIDLIERLLSLRYTYKESEKMYLKYAQDDKLLDLETKILEMEIENEKKYAK